MNLALELVGRSGLSRASVAGSLPPSCTVEFEVSRKRRDEQLLFVKRMRYNQKW